MTQIGKLVNSLRKWNGEVSMKSKVLVKKWKMLLVELEPVQEQNCSRLESPTRIGEMSSLATRTGEEIKVELIRPIEIITDESRMERRKKHGKKHHHHQSSLPRVCGSEGKNKQLHGRH